MDDRLDDRRKENNNWLWVKVLLWELMGEKKNGGKIKKGKDAGEGISFLVDF